MPQLRFSLDGVVFDHPINWMDVKIRYKRDDVVRGLFTTFTSDMVWTGAEYAYLVNLWDNLTCDTADLLIESRCGRYGTWTTLLEGKLMLNTAKIDRQKCTLTCNAEQSGCQGTFFNNLETDFDIGQEGTAGVDLWKEVTNNFVVCAPIVLDPLCPGGLTPAVPFAGSYGKSIKTIFSQLINLASNNCLGFVSDWFDQVHNAEIWQLEGTVAMTAGHIFTMTWDDEFGNSHQVDVESSGVIATDMQLISNTMLYMSSIPVGGIYNPYTSRNRKGEVAFNAFTNPTTLVSTWHFVPQNIAISYPSGTFIFTRLQNGNVGGGENYSIVPSLFHATGNYTVQTVLGVNWASLAQGSLMMNFKTIFEVADKLWNLGMQIEPDGLGGWQVRIEPIEYFYSAVPTITIRELFGVEHSAQEKLFAKRWHFGKKTDQVNTVYTDFNPEESTIPGSLDAYTSCFSEWWVDAATNCLPTYDRRYNQMEYVLGLGLTYQEDILTGLIENELYNYIICVNHAVPAGVDTARYYRYDTYSTLPPTALVDQYFYDVKTQPEQIYIRHQNIMPEHTLNTNFYQSNFIAPFAYTQTQTPSATTIPEGAYWLPYEWKFKEYISDADWVLLVSSQIITVNETNNPANDQNGYLKEVTYRISDGNTEFIIEAKA